MPISQHFGWHIYTDCEMSECQLRGLYWLLMTRGGQGGLIVHLRHSPR